MRFHVGFSFKWKTIKKFIIPFLFGLILYFCNHLVVYATTYTLPQPQIYAYDTSNHLLISGNATQDQYYNTLYWKSPYQMGACTNCSGGDIASTVFSLANANLCVRSNGSPQYIAITGFIYGFYNMQNEMNPLFFLYSGGRQMSCQFTWISSSEVAYSCSGIGGGEFRVAIQQNNFIPNIYYTVGITKNVDITCTATEEDSINQSIQNTTEIINNNNQNTQSIINNNNQNTQDIIDNQNEIAQQQEQNQQVCRYIDVNNIIQDGQLYSDGSIGSTQTFGVTDYIDIIGAKIKLLTTFSNTTYARTCFYDVNKRYISCLKIDNSYSVNSYLDIPANAQYFRATIQKALNIPTFELCKNGNQAINDALTDDDISGSITSGNAYFGKDIFSKTYGISDLINVPFNFIQSLTNTTCEPLEFTLPFVDQDIIIPCISDLIETNFKNLFDLYQLIIGGVIAFYCAIGVYHDIERAINPYRDMPVTDMFI